MKVLFVDNANVARSQVAEALFNRLSGAESASAGTRADDAVARTKPSSRMLKDSVSSGIPYMNDQGIDISGKLRKQLTEEMVREADKVIFIADKDTWSDYLRNSEKVVVLDPADTLGLEPDSARPIFDEIKRRVQELVREIG